jgi:hypothetical protein
VLPPAADRSDREPEVSWAIPTFDRHLVGGEVVYAVADRLARLAIPAFVQP